jgi:3-oxoacyl-[acyl-carrier protein] reductase
MARLAGKVAIVTGATRGIGRATAKLFAAEGAKVVVLSRTTEAVDRVVADICGSGGVALGVVCDTADPEQIKTSVDKVMAAYGRIDILVNNAFDPSAVLSSILDLSVETLQRNFEMGPIAYLRIMQACYPHLTARCTRLGGNSLDLLDDATVVLEGIRFLPKLGEWGLQQPS